MSTISTMLVGADADELQRSAAMLRSAADELDGRAVAVTATVRSVTWVGGVAERFGAEWSGGHRPRIASTARHIRDAAGRLDRQAAEQRMASRADTDGPRPSAQVGATRGAPAGDEIAPARPGAVDRIERLVAGIGVAREQAEIIADLASRLQEHGEFGALIDLIADDSFATFLDGADLVIDAGAVVVDAVIDFADHADLPFDERTVHALADAAVRFGLDQGMEVAAEWLAGAATVALLPGFGAILAPLVGEISGAIADELVDIAVDTVDAATDIVDAVADAVVGAYRDVKDTFGVVADVADAAIDVGGAAVDLAGDAAGELMDGGGAVIAVGADVVVGIVGAVNPFD